MLTSGSGASQAQVSHRESSKQPLTLHTISGHASIRLEYSMRSSEIGERNGITQSSSLSRRIEGRFSYSIASSVQHGRLGYSTAGQIVLILDSVDKTHVRVCKLEADSAFGLP